MSLKIDSIKYIPPILTIIIGFVCVVIITSLDRSIEKAIALIGAFNIGILGFIWVDIKRMVKL